MKSKIKSLCEISLFVSLMAICAWITIPFAIPFTLQTFAVFLCCLYLGGKKAIISTAVYIFTGIIGVPVFSSFSSGIGAFLGATGGFLLGFMLITVVYYIFTTLFGNRNIIKITGCISGTLICYIFGTVWYILLYSGGDDSLLKSLYACVIPFIIPDALKLFLAYSVYAKITGALSIKK